MKKGLSIALAAVFAGGAVGGLGYLSKGFENWNTDEWLDKPAQTTPEDNESLTVTPTEGATFRLTAFRSTSDRSAGQTVSVVDPIDGFDYTWSLSDGGGEYIELSSTSGSSVTVAAKQPFGTSITLSCSAYMRGTTDPIGTATCTLGYRKRFLGVIVNGVRVNDGDHIELSQLTSGNYAEYVNNFTYALSPALTEGTVTVDSTISSVSVTALGSPISQDGISAQFLQYRALCNVFGTGSSQASQWMTQIKAGNASYIKGVYQSFVNSKEDYTFKCSCGENNITFYVNLSESMFAPYLGASMSLDTPSVIF